MKSRQIIPLEADTKYKAMRKFYITILYCFISVVLSANVSSESLNFAFGKAIHGSLATESGGTLAKIWPALRTEGNFASDTILISAGDMLGPSSPLDPDDELRIIHLMNLSGFQVMGIHPNDFSIGLPALLNCAEAASFPLVFSNGIFNKKPVGTGTGKILPYYKKTYNGKTVLFVSLISPEVKSEWPNWDPGIEVEECEKTLELLKKEGENASCTILLSTMTLVEVQTLFWKFPWLDFAVLNSSPKSPPSIGISFEHRFTDGRSVFYANSKETLAGKISFERMDKKAKIFGEALIHREGMIEDQEIRAEIQKQIEEFQVGKFSEDSKLSQEEIDDLENVVLNAFRIETCADFTMMDMSGFRNPDSKVPTTFGKYLRSVYPAIDRVALIELKGGEIRSLLGKVRNSKVLSEIIRFAGLTQHDGIKINGRTLNETEKYRLVTSEFFALGGMDIFPKGSGKILSKSISDIIDDFFLKHTAGERKALIACYDERTIYKQSGNLNFNLDKTAYSGPVERYTNKGSGGMGLFTGVNYNIPELIGAEYQQKRFNFEENMIVDRPESDLRLSLKANFFDYDEYRLQDTMEFLSNYVINKTKSPVMPFITFRYQSSLRAQQQEPKYPRYGYLMAGGLWKPGESKSKWYTPLSIYIAGGRIFRTKDAEVLVNDSYGFGFEYSKLIFHNWEFSLNGAYYGSFEASGIRGSDVEATLKMPITRTLSTILKTRRFEWEEKIVGEAVIRKDLFLGLNFERTTRWF
ncbi:MAG: hypothetical protein HQM10_18935 [Candidatus Riflebacteria bacterium]|nr:hypothetical protein [Candidatus Riflebacteria bacterium]